MNEISRFCLKYSIDGGLETRQQQLGLAEVPLAPINHGLTRESLLHQEEAGGGGGRLADSKGNLRRSGVKL